MTNALTIPANAALSPAMQKYLAEQGGLKQELGAGVTAGFAVVGYKGKVWSIKHRGDVNVQLRPDDKQPKARMEFVVVKAAPTISKILYIDGWNEESTAPPDCWSVDGVRPDPASPKKQCSSCAGCPMNQWGSAITPAGKKTKKCTDSKRLAVVPSDDIDNHRYGGPMLLRVPAASLGDMANYDSMVTAKGFPYFAISTAISFDFNESYPKFVFDAIRPLTDEEFTKVIEMRDSEQVARILSAPVEEVTADVASPSLSQQATARDPAVVEAERQAAVKAAQEAVAAANAEKAKAAAETPEAMQARIEAEVRAKAQAEMEARVKAEAEAKAKAEAEAEAKAKAEAEAKAKAGPSEAEIRAAIEAKVRAEMEAKANSGATGQANPLAGVSTAGATLVAANNDTPSTATAAASDVVDAEIISEQNEGKSPEAFDALLDKMLES